MCWRYVQVFKCGHGETQEVSDPCYKAIADSRAMIQSGELAWGRIIKCAPEDGDITVTVLDADCIVCTTEGEASAEVVFENVTDSTFSCS